MSFPGKKYFTHVVTALGELISTTHVTSPGEASWKFVPGFLWNSLHVPFPFDNLALYPFVVINLSYEYDYILSFANPPSKSPNLEVVLGGTSDTAIKIHSSI